VATGTNVFKCYKKTLENCVTVVKSLNEYNNLPEGINIKITLSKQRYIQNIKEALALKRIKGLHGQHDGASTMRKVKFSKSNA